MIEREDIEGVIGPTPGSLEDDKQQTPIPITPPIRINCGGLAYPFKDTEWMADQYYNGGAIFRNPAVVAGTENQTLYHSHRYAGGGLGTLIYSVPVAPGEYTVVLHFAAIHPTSQGAIGRRVFQASINDGPSRTVDVFAASGSFVAHQEPFDVVHDGTHIKIMLIPVADLPYISGIEILPKAENILPPNPTPDPDATGPDILAVPVQLALNGNTLTLTVEATDAIRAWVGKLLG